MTRSDYLLVMCEHIRKCFIQKNTFLYNANANVSTKIGLKKTIFLLIQP